MVTILPRVADVLLERLYLPLQLSQVWQWHDWRRVAPRRHTEGVCIVPSQLRNLTLELSDLLAQPIRHLCRGTARPANSVARRERTPHLTLRWGIHALLAAERSSHSLYAFVWSISASGSQVQVHTGSPLFPSPSWRKTSQLG